VNRGLFQEPLLGIDDFFPLIVRLAGMQITAFVVSERTSPVFERFKRRKNLQE